MHYFPSEGWLDAYGRELDASDALDDLALGWGDAFDGSIRFVIADLPLSETRLGDLPPELLEDLPERVVEGFADVTLAEAPDVIDDSLRGSLPAAARDLLDQVEANVVDGDIHAFVDLSGGDCDAVEVLADPDERETGFVIRGDYDAWRQVVDGRPPAAAILAGDLVVEGNGIYQLRYSAMFQLLGELAADVETTHLFEGRRQSPAGRMLDQAVRQPALVQRTAERSVVRTLDLF